MIALVIGATGATGFSLVQQLLEDTRFKEVVVFVRSGISLKHEKLVAHQVDFNNYETWAALVQGDVAFSCLGTTLKQAGSKDNQWKVDYDYQYNFAQVASENKVPTFVLVSAQGADPKSSMFYSRMKGELEVALSKLTFDNLVLLRPGLLQRPNSDRFGERMVEGVLCFFNNLGMFKSYKPLPVSKLAATMIEKGTNPKGGIEKVVSNWQ